MKELYNVKANVDYLLGESVMERERDNARQ